MAVFPQAARATHELVLSAHGAAPVVERVREEMVAVARGWVGPT